MFFDRGQGVPSVIASFDAYLEGDFDEATIRAIYPREQWEARRRLKALEHELELIEAQMRALKRTGRTMAEVEEGLQGIFEAYPEYLPILQRVLARLQGGH